MCIKIQKTSSKTQAMVTVLRLVENLQLRMPTICNTNMLLYRSALRISKYAYNVETIPYVGEFNQ